MVRYGTVCHSQLTDVMDAELFAVWLVKLAKDIKAINPYRVDVP